MLFPFTSKVQYPKLLILSVCILGSYLLFQMDFFQNFAQLLNGHGYASIFLAGFLFAYGFTAPLAVGFFISLAPNVNIFLAAALAGVGALISDFFIFRFIKTSFQDEFDRLKLTRFFQRLRSVLNHRLSRKLKQYALWVFAGFLIASPLPDEFGVSLVSGFTSLDAKTFVLISYLLNTSGILAILALA